MYKEEEIGTTISEDAWCNRLENMHSYSMNSRVRVSSFKARLYVDLNVHVSNISSPNVLILQ